MPFDPNSAALPDSGIFGLPHAPQEAHVVLLPVPFEATVSFRKGTAAGPQAILQASKQVDLFDLSTGAPYQSGIAMLDIPRHVREWSDEAQQLAAPIIQAGGVPQAADVDALCEQMNSWVYKTTQHWLSQGKRLGLVGGDHSTAFGSIQAHAEAHENLGILHIDAHADLREAYEGFTWSHASIMFNVLKRVPQVSKIVQVGIRDLSQIEFHLIQNTRARIHTFFDEQLQNSLLSGIPWRETVELILKALPQRVYLSCDIDGFDPALCPHTGTPVPGGLSFPMFLALLEGIHRLGKCIVGFDLTEVAPHPNDANVASRLLYKTIGWMLLSQQHAA